MGSEHIPRAPGEKRKKEKTIRKKKIKGML